MSAAERLSEELWPGREYNRLTSVEQSYTLILDAGRMPTVRGPRGTIADRTVTATTRDGTPGLHAAYFLAYLPGQDADFPHHTLTLVDYDYWRKRRGGCPLDPRMMPEGRYRIELWDACPDYEGGETGHPETDHVWVGNNPYWRWDVPARFGLTGARAALEVLAAHLVREHLSVRRRRATVQARVARWHRAHARELATLDQTYFADAVQRFNAWRDRPMHRAHDRLDARMIAAAEAAEAPATVQDPQPYRIVTAVAGRWA